MKLVPLGKVIHAKILILRVVTVNPLLLQLLFNKQNPVLSKNSYEWYEWHFI